MAYKVIILYRLYMPSYFLETFTEYPYVESEERMLSVKEFLERRFFLTSREGKAISSESFYVHIF